MRLPVHSQGDSWFPGVPGVAGKLPGGCVSHCAGQGPGGLGSSIVRWTAGHLHHFILFSHPSLKIHPSRGTSFTPAPGGGVRGARQRVTPIIFLGKQVVQE